MKTDKRNPYAQDDQGLVWSGSIAKEQHPSLETSMFVPQDSGSESSGRV